MPALLHLLLAALTLAALQAQAPWRFANPRPHGNNIIDMALRDGVVWQIGDRGSLHTSPDLENWQPHDTGVTASLRGIAFLGPSACIVGEEGTVLHGPAPASLSVVKLPTTDWLEAVAASPAELVAVGDNGAVYRSTNGLAWTRTVSLPQWLRTVAYGGGQFLAAGENGFAATSPNGVAWTTRDSGVTAHLNRAAYLDGRFWLVGENGTILTNNFRMQFSNANSGVTNNFFAIVSNGPEIVVAGDQAVLLRTSNGSWAPQMDAATAGRAPLWPYYSALWDGRLFLLGGRTGMQVEGFRTNSAAPLQWFSAPQPTRSWLWSATRQGDLIAAVGAAGTILTSLDGVDWRREVAPAAARTEILLGVGGNTNALVAAGSGGLILTSPNIVTNLAGTPASLLGVFWNSAPSPTRNDLQGVAANASTFVVTGARGTILTSHNGTNWQARASGTAAYLSGVTAWPGGFLACGDAGTILSSPDGAAWQPRSAPVNTWIYALRHLGGKLVAVGQGGLILTSDNGVDWTQRASGTTEWINDVAFANGQWMAVSGAGWLISSEDSITWTARKSITARSLYAAVSDGDQFIAAGLEGVILRQPLSIAATPVGFLSIAAAPGAALLLLGGQPGQRFELQSQPALGGAWQGETTLEFPPDGFTLTHQRPRLATERSRFFRTRLLP